MDWGSGGSSKFAVTGLGCLVGENLVSTENHRIVGAQVRPFSKFPVPFFLVYVLSMMDESLAHNKPLT